MRVRVSPSAPTGPDPIPPGHGGRVALALVTTLNYLVPGITCGHCKAAIESEVGQVSGVEHVQVDVDSKRVAVEGEATEEAILAAIAEAGYDEVQKV